MKILIFLTLFIAVPGNLFSQESVFSVKRNTWDPSGTWRVSARTEQSMFHEQWYFAPDNTFFVMARGDRNNLPESFGTWEQTGSDLIMKYQQYKGKSCSGQEVSHHFRIDYLSANNVRLNSLVLDASIHHPVSVQLFR